MGDPHSSLWTVDRRDIHLYWEHNAGIGIASDPTHVDMGPHWVRIQRTRRPSLDSKIEDDQDEKFPVPHSITIEELSIYYNKYNIYNVIILK